MLDSLLEITRWENYVILTLAVIGAFKALLDVLPPGVPPTQDDFPEHRDPPEESE